LEIQWRQGEFVEFVEFVETRDTIEFIEFIESVESVEFIETGYHSLRCMGRQPDDTDDQASCDESKSQTANDLLTHAAAIKTYAN
jgi:hypothetical protein